MNLIVLDTDLNSIFVLDTFESLIWTERYIGYGDFELYINMDESLLNVLRIDYYLYLSDPDEDESINASKQTMIIEDIKIETDVENGNHLVVTGRSLESILDRRIVWKQTFLHDIKFQDGIETLLNDNIISPDTVARKVERLRFEESQDQAITSLKVDTQFTGDNLYTAIKKLCEINSIGFKIYLSSSNEFVFQLYSGVNRSYDQSENSYVVFSPKFENLINSNYIKSKKTLKTITLVAGEGEGNDRKHKLVAIEEGEGLEGLDRRELYTDARDISSKVDNEPLTRDEYGELLRQRGKEDLAENTITESFEGQVDTLNMFKYGKDFFKGDIVQIINEYGMQSKSRVTEFVRSIKENSIEEYPTFVTIK